MEEILNNVVFYSIFCIISFVLGIILYWGFKTEYGAKKIDFEVNIFVIIMIFAFSILSYITASILAGAIIMTFLICFFADDERSANFKKKFKDVTTINISNLLRKLNKKNDKIN